MVLGKFSMAMQYSMCNPTNVANSHNCRRTCTTLTLRIASSHQQEPGVSLASVEMALETKMKMKSCLSKSPQAPPSPLQAPSSFSQAPYSPLEAPSSFSQAPYSSPQAPSSSAVPQVAKAGVMPAAQPAGASGLPQNFTLTPGAKPAEADPLQSNDAWAQTRAGTAGNLFGWNGQAQRNALLY